MCCQIPFDNPRLVITSEGLFFLDVFHQKLKSGSWSITCMDAIISILEQLQAQSGYVVCPGVNFALFQDKIRVMKSLRLWGIPFNRHDSAKCLMWHKPKQLRSSQYSSDLAIKREMCSECRSLVTELRRQHKKATDIPDCVRDKRRSASSDMKELYMSPQSLAKKRRNQSRERKAMQKSLKQYRKNDITLNSDHHREMCQLTSTIHSNYWDNLEQLFTEAEAANPQQS